MRLSLAHSHAVRTIGASSDACRRTAERRVNQERQQALKDKLYVAVAALLVLATVTMSALYVVHELPRWRTGQIGGFAPVAPPAIQERDATADIVPIAPAPAPVAERAMSRLSLVLWSMLIEMAIFCGLGLYLRHDMNRQP